MYIKLHVFRSYIRPRSYVELKILYLAFKSRCETYILTAFIVIVIIRDTAEKFNSSAVCISF